MSAPIVRLRKQAEQDFRQERTKGLGVEAHLAFLVDKWKRNNEPQTAAPPKPARTKLTIAPTENV